MTIKDLHTKLHVLKIPEDDYYLPGLHTCYTRNKGNFAIFELMNKKETIYGNGIKKLRNPYYVYNYRY